MGISRVSSTSGPPKRGTTTAFITVSLLFFLFLCLLISELLFIQSNLLIDRSKHLVKMITLRHQSLPMLAQECQTFQKGLLGDLTMFKLFENAPILSNPYNNFLDLLQRHPSLFIVRDKAE